MIELTKINRAEAFRYMGLREEPPENISSLADECESRLISAASPKFHWVYADISENSGDVVTLSGYRLVLRGKDISEHLSGCFGAALLCATLGDGVDKLLRTVQAEDMAKAVTVDAFASTAVEQVCDIAEKEIEERFAEKFTTWRFSPGYGDFPLECQGDFLGAVNAMRTVGVCVTEGGLLTPTKSVTAVIGISETEVPRKHRGCGTCSIRDKCNFRKNGGHCNE
ncbi:MAG: methionine synthase [Oscillospiraceae bacterium]|nr:methionine synthase [Oscillospiraceae bacterium]